MVGKLSQDKVRDQIDSEKRTNYTFWKPSEGENNIRLLPPATDDAPVFVKTATAWKVGPEAKNLSLPLDEKGKITGWLINKIYELKDSEDEADKKLADSIYPKSTWLYNIIDLDKPNTGFQILECGILAHKQICLYLYDQKGDYGDITDLTEGYDVTYTKTSEGGINVKYDVRCRPKPSSLSPALLKLISENDLPDLTSIRKIATDEEQQAAFEGTGEALPEAPEAQPVVRQSARPTPAAEDDDEEAEAETTEKKSFGNRIS